MIFERYSDNRLLEDRNADLSEVGRLIALIRNIPGFVAVLRGPELICEFANSSYCEIIGNSEVLGRSARKSLLEAGRQACMEIIARAYHSGEPIVGRSTRIDTHSSAGEERIERYIDFVCQPIFEGGRIAGVFIQGHEVAKPQQSAIPVREDDAQDFLTGLLNRRAFERKLEEAVTDMRHDALVTLLYLDLDQFKIINETCGHRMGDDFLRHVAGILVSCLQSTAILSRLGGDEFGVLLTDCSEAEYEAIANMLRWSINQLEHACQSKVFCGSVSIGLVSLTKESMTAQEALGAADAACYLAKEKGRNRVQVFKPATDEIKSIWGQMDIVGHLSVALREGRLELFGQKIQPLNLDIDYPDHFEVLLRLRNRDGTLLAPAAFIPAAERYGLMQSIDRYVVQRAFAVSVSENIDAGSPLILSINLSGNTLSDSTFISFIQDEVFRSGVDPNNIYFEITETAAVNDSAESAKAIDSLRGQGFRFALDDFGSGVSTFGYLRSLPVDCVKIDGVFIRNMVSNEVDAAMVEAIARIAKVMGVLTVAEYVEDEKTIAALSKIGIDFGQGYGIHIPEPLSRCRRRNLL